MTSYAVNAAVPAAIQTKSPVNPFSLVPKSSAGQNRTIRVPLQFSGNAVKVMTYNTENFFDDVDDPNTPMDDTQWTKPIKSIRALAEVIKMEDPDILALQEVENREVLEDLNRNHLGGQYPNIIIFPTNDGRGIRVAYMTKSNIKQVDSISHRNDRCGKDLCFKRDLLEATFETPSGLQLTLFNTHFKSMRGGERETTPIRLQEAGRARQIFTEKLKKNPDAKLMLVGDLNSLHTQNGRRVLDTIANDPQGDPNLKMTELLEQNGQVPPTQGRKNKKRNRWSKLDYCYASPSLLQIAKARVAGKLGQQPWATASDHVPVVIEIDDKARAISNAALKFSGTTQKPITGTRILKMV